MTFTKLDIVFIVVPFVALVCFIWFRLCIDLPDGLIDHYRVGKGKSFAERVRLRAAGYAEAWNRKREG